MNYQNIYNQLIESAQLNPKPDQYKEDHHIMPVCLGGSNSESNLVKLTARQHFLAHWLLYKIHRTSKLAHAWFSMCRVGKGQGARKVNSRYFNNAKQAHRMHLSEDNKGDKNWFYGKSHSSESKQKMLESRNKTFQENPEQLKSVKDGQSKRFSDLWKGKPKPASQKEKIGAAGKGKMTLKNVETGECIKILKSDIVKYDQSIWKSPLHICKHSGLGSKWCTNGKENIKLKQDEKLPEGFYYGRTNKRKDDAN